MVHRKPLSDAGQKVTDRAHQLRHLMLGYLSHAPVLGLVALAATHIVVGRRGGVLFSHDRPQSLEDRDVTPIAYRPVPRAV